LSTKETADEGREIGLDLASRLRLRNGIVGLDDDSAVADAELFGAAGVGEGEGGGADVLFGTGGARDLG
jgi:hypothetical protein